MSVVKRGEVWYIRYELPRDATGRRRQRMLACPGLNKKQAEQRLRDTLSALHNGTYSEPSTVTLRDWLAEWLTHQAQRLSPTSMHSYRLNCKNHIIPALGDLRLDKLTPADLQGFYAKLADTLAPKTVSSVHGILHAALAYAMRLQLISRNPADLVDVPRFKRPEITTASIEELASLRSALVGTRYYLPVLVVIATGMRRGEVCGLRWEDYTVETRTLAVRRSAYHADGQTQVKATKSNRARVVLLPRFVADELAQAQKPAGWMFPNPKGGLQNPQAFADGVKRIAKRAGVSVTLHGLRHTQATLLIMAGVPVKVVSERLGHSTVNITQDIYTHVLPPMQEGAAELLDEWFGDGRVQNVCKEA